MGIHSALAIKRQRKRRDDQKKARERRYSIQSTESGDTGHSPHGSTRRKHRHQYGGHPDGNNLDSKVSFFFLFQYIIRLFHCIITLSAMIMRSNAKNIKTSFTFHIL